MPKTISAREATDALAAMLDRAHDDADEVIVELGGEPRVVFMPFAGYEELRELRLEARRNAVIERIRRLQADVSARNRDLTDDEAMELADRFVHDVVDDLAREGTVVFERDLDA